MLRTAVLVAAACAAAAPALAQQFEAVQLGTLGGPGSSAFGVNDTGVVVGASDLPDGTFHAFVWENGVMTDLGTLGGEVSTAFSVNNAGVVVGRAKNAAGVDRAVRWFKDGQGVWQIEDLGTLNGDNSGFGWATRINNAGQIVGYATAGQPYHAFIWENGVMTDVGTLDYTGNLAYSQALGISDSGQVVGFAYRVLGGPEHGFVTVNGRQEDITPAFSFSLAQGHNINTAGVIGGYIANNTTGGAFRAAYMTPGSGWTLIPLLDGMAESYGYDINEAGEMVGVSFVQSTPPLIIFRGYFFDGEQTLDLNDVTSGLPGTVIDAYDISNTRMIAANADSIDGPIALLIRPMATPGCPADWDQSGGVDGDDIGAFFTDWQAGNADIDQSGGTDGDDITVFFNHWQAGC